MVAPLILSQEEKVGRVGAWEEGGSTQTLAPTPVPLYALCHSEVSAGTALFSSNLFYKCQVFCAAPHRIRRLLLGSAPTHILTSHLQMICPFLTRNNFQSQLLLDALASLEESLSNMNSNFRLATVGKKGVCYHFLGNLRKY